MPPIQMQLFSLFANEIVYHCDGMFEYHRLLREYSGIGKPQPAEGVDPFQHMRRRWIDRYMVEGIISHAAGISRIFFPIDEGSKTKRRARLLKEWFAVPEDSVFLSRSVRDALHHTDERLDKYFQAIKRYEEGGRVDISPPGPLEEQFGISTEGFSVIWFNESISNEDGKAMLEEAARLKAKATMHIPMLGNRRF